MPNLYLIRVTGGDCAGRYVGPSFGGGLITDKNMQANPEVKVPGTKYSLHAQEGPATKFFEHAAPGVQAEFKQLGYQTELVLLGDGIDYPATWVPMEDTCKCGVKRRVDVQVVTGHLMAGSEYQHCPKDEIHFVPGPIIATFDERDGKWVLTGKR